MYILYKLSKLSALMNSLEYYWLSFLLLFAEYRIIDTYIEFSAKKLSEIA